MADARACASLRRPAVGRHLPPPRRGGPVLHCGALQQRRDCLLACNALTCSCGGRAVAGWQGAPPASIQIPSFLINTRGYFIHGSHIGSPEELDAMLKFW